VSVFKGDEKDGVPFDQEAWDIWKAILGGEERIILGNKKDNFWEMGDVGPCGPCSEIHIDLRDQAEVDVKAWQRTRQRRPPASGRNLEQRIYAV
jgi:alanyl-tRNA synthetase